MPRSVRIDVPQPTWKTGFARSASESVVPHLWKGLVGAWSPGLGPTGGMLRDVSRFGSNGTLTGTTWDVNDGRYALGLFGASDVATIAHTKAINVGKANESFSVICWFRAGIQDSPVSALIHKGTGVNDRVFQVFFHVNNDFFRFQMFDGTNNPSADTASLSNITDDEWHLFVGVRDVAASQMLVFIDGIDATSASNNVAFDVDFSNTGNLTVGDAALGMDNDYNGFIDDLGLVNRALNASETQKLWQIKRGGIFQRRPITIAKAPAAPTGGVARLIFLTGEAA